jgi:hypothetical protein
MNPNRALCAAEEFALHCRLLDVLHAPLLDQIPEILVL